MPDLRKNQPADYLLDRFLSTVIGWRVNHTGAMLTKQVRLALPRSGTFAGW
jgi:hypothetical protein